MAIDRFSGISLLEEIEKFNQSKEEEAFDPSVYSWKTIDRLRLKPFFTKNDIGEEQDLKSTPGNFPYTRGYQTTDNDWIIRVDIDTRDAEDANRKAIEAISKGAEGIQLNVKHFTSAEQFGTLLNGVDETDIFLDFKTEKNTLKVAELFIEHLENHNIDKSRVRVAFDYDPIACLIKSGHFNEDKNEDFRDVVKLIELFERQLPYGKCLTINTQHLHNAGATAVQEVGFSLGIVTEYLNFLIKEEFDIDRIAKRIKFNWAVSTNLNIEVAKLRTIRSIWATIIKQYEPKDNSTYMMDIHCISANTNKSIYNPYMNIVRATNEAIAAITGGCNSLSLSTHDSIYKTPDDPSEALSRNIQLLLKNESNLNKVIDPYAGSYFMENLTNQLASRAWRLFQEVEQGGGFINSMKSGLIKAEIDAVVDIRNMKLANRENIIIGTNHFVIDQEQLLMDVDIDVYTSTTKSSVHEEITPPLTPYRGAKNFESIRLKSEQYGLVKGSTPKVYLMQIGAINKNASLAFNLFAVGGYNIKRSPIFRDVDSAIAEAKNEQADIVIISTDPNDKDIMEKCLAELNGSTSLVVAGKAEHATIKEMKSKGIVTFIHEHTDVINVLKYFHQEFGIM